MRSVCLFLTCGFSPFKFEFTGPEDDLLLQMQGIIAEYERAKFMERSRRGKRHAAQGGSLNVMSCAPFGYRYVSVREGGGKARFEPNAEQARVVQRIFSWIGRDRCSLNEVCRRLQKAGELTASGRRVWSKQAVWHILQNPAYVGRAAYGKTRMMPRTRKTRPRPPRGRPAEPRPSFVCFRRTCVTEPAVAGGGFTRPYPWPGGAARVRV